MANLPYNIATPILGNLLGRGPPPQTMTVTIQKELAERIAARPGSKDYGALSIWVQSQCRVEILRVLPPDGLLAAAEGLVGLHPDHPGRESAQPDPRPQVFPRFCAGVFCHRRKFLRSELLSVVKGKLGKPEVDAILARLNFAATARAEELDVDTMLVLCEAVRPAFVS